MSANKDTQEYIPFRVSTLRGDQKITFNAYLRINGKYILYVRSGDSFEGERIKKLKEKKLKEMFLRPEEFPLYQQYLERNIDSVYDSRSEKDLKTRAEIIQGIQQHNAEEVFENPGSPESYQEAKAGVGDFLSFLTNEEEGYRAILAIENTDHSVAHHCVSVATLAVKLMLHTKMERAAIQLVALGALLHDFDHHHNGLILTKSTKQLLATEGEKYRNHPAHAAAALREQRHFDPLVLKIILQHEEAIDGSGFPNQLKERDLEPGAIMVAAANALDRLSSFEGRSRHDAAREFTINSVGRYPLDYIKYLSTLAAKL